MFMIKKRLVFLVLLLLISGCSHSKIEKNFGKTIDNSNRSIEKIFENYELIDYKIYNNEFIAIAANKDHADLIVYSLKDEKKILKEKIHDGPLIKATITILSNGFTINCGNNLYTSIYDKEYKLIKSVDFSNYNADSILPTCISQDLKAKFIWGYFFRKTLMLYNQIWVLDSYSEKSLKNIEILKDRVFLTPNSIDVPDTFCLSTKKINRVAFVGNLEPTKGLFELIQAVLKIDYDIKLFIVGPGASNVIDKIKILAGVDLGHKIILMGGMANEDVINFMKTIDILVLPTYYKAEAFPISILEAMSLGKIVISTERAAIKDMLTGKNGNNCGLFVKEKSVDDIVDKIKYCIENHNEAELLMKNAYNKVWESYRKEVVYDIYRLHYSSLIQ